MRGLGAKPLVTGGIGDLEASSAGRFFRFFNEINAFLSIFVLKFLL